MFPAGYDLLTWPGLEICEMLLILLTSGAFIAFQFDQQLDYASKVFLILLCIMVMSFLSLSLSHIFKIILLLDFLLIFFSIQSRCISLIFFSIFFIVEITMQFFHVIAPLCFPNCSGST